MAETRSGEEGRTRVMVAIDDSECSHYALKWALDNLHDSLAASHPLIVFAVQPLATPNYLPAATFASGPALVATSTAPELNQLMQEHRKNISLALLDRAKAMCAKSGVVTETFTEVGDPKEAILQAVEKFKINMLILGSHGRGTLQRAFLGSVSNYCVQNAKCPVLVVKKSM